MRLPLDTLRATVAEPCHGQHVCWSEIHPNQKRVSAVPATTLPHETLATAETKFQGHDSDKHGHPSLLALPASCVLEDLMLM